MMKNHFLTTEQQGELRTKATQIVEKPIRLSDNNQEMKMQTETIKPVNRTIAIQMKRDYKQGLGQEEIAKKYSDMGYVSPRGKELTQPVVSSLIRKKATGKKTTRRKHKKRAAVATTTKAKATGNVTLDDVMLAIANCVSIVPQKKAKLFWILTK